ncbi:PAS domain S-box protein [Janthinobacterium sp. 17J80-10]|uniref:PAS domain-containing hybrid sensor histidine kinase/response regulator n=1 Tax=Janthinobacterium sp. 17J80-10 TaxID=2497863 RepID=UPI0010054951|nr:PAS domain S-box protein [Janthinobacterium sp. 17J80-10]QAU34520.1 PAS domain S-box protein [Janthinobacterium sp. 17J80-10]
MPQESAVDAQRLSLSRRYELLVESVTDYAIYMLTPEGIVSTWNPGAARFKGHTAAEIVGLPFSLFYTEEDRLAQLPRRALEIAEREGKFESEGWRVRKDGSRFWASVVIDPVRDESGELLGFAKVTRDISDKRAAQEALLASERRFRYLVKGVTDYAIYMLSPEGEVTNWNPGAHRIKGYTDEEAIGMHFSSFYTDEDRAARMPQRALATALREGRFEAEGWRLRKDRSRFWASVVIDPVYDDSGALLGFAKVTRDITERREAMLTVERAREAALQAKTAEYEDLVRLFDQAHGFICFFRGPEHVYELANEAHAQLAQYRDVIGKPVRQALPELEGQGFFELLDRVFSSGEPFIGRSSPITVNKVPDEPGEIRYIDFVYQPIFDNDNKVIGIFSQGSDVTDRVRAQEQVERKQEALEKLIVERTDALNKAELALQRARQLQGDKTHLLALFDQAPGFICVLMQRNHVIELANKAYYQLVGHRNLIGRPAQEALPDIAGQGFLTLLDEVFETGKPYIGEDLPITFQEHPERPKRTRYLDFVYQPITGEDGKVIGIFVQGNDVTNRKLAQDELKRYQAELETIIAERTRALEDAHTALHNAQKLESIGKLTGGVAHDFNNILQVIGGNLQLLQFQLGSNEMAAKRLEAANAAVERGGKLSSQLLAFARRQPLQPVIVNPDKIIHGMDDMLKRALGEEITVKTVIAAGIWNMSVDPHRLENALLNLAFNARDAMPNGGMLTIEVINSVLDEHYVAPFLDVSPGSYVMFAVSDSGTGMPSEIVAKACDPFFTTKAEGEGTGLGLPMVYGFVKQSGGHFQIHSAVGYGTTIMMYFPRSLESESDVPGHDAGPIAGGSETILVVEDDIAVQATVVEMLTSLGYRVLKAQNAASALVILKSGVSVDVLFTDVVMPGELRSPDLARQAKTLVPNIVILFTSGYTQDVIVHGGRLDAGVHLISKPYRREELAQKIRHLLSGREQGALAENEFR